MTEKIGHIRNPLTVIAIFAGIAEVSGTVVLPFVASANQELYIYFLIWFPSYLVTLFFLVLLFKHKVFYAPSDFKDDKSFMELLRPVSVSDRMKQIDSEIREDTQKKPDTITSTAGDQAQAPEKKESAKDEASNIRSRYLAAEELVVSLISKEMSLPFHRNVEVGGHGKSISFDAFAPRGEKLIAIEVKYVRHPVSIQMGIRRSLERLTEYAASLPEPMRAKMNIIFAVVLDEQAALRKDYAIGRLNQLKAQFPIISELRVFTFDELQKITDGA